MKILPRKARERIPQRRVQSIAPIISERLSKVETKSKNGNQQSGG